MIRIVKAFGGWRVSAAALVLPLALLAGCRTERRAPNVLLIVVDTLRADYLGTYGFQGDVSPHVDDLAAESVTFTHCISQAPWTSPSMASMVTSLHPQNHCVFSDDVFCGESKVDNWGALSPEATTLAEALQSAGYRTAGFVANYLVKASFGFEQGFDLYVEPPGKRQHLLQGDMVFQRALQWLDDRADDDRPFFVYVHLMDIHGPYRPRQEDLQALGDSVSLGEDRVLSDEELKSSELESWTLFQQHLRNWRLAYAGGIRAFDVKLGAFLDAFRAMDSFDDTIVVFTADHGEEFLEHGKWWHGDTDYNQALHVPLLIRFPGGEFGGQRIDRTVSSIDIMPTLLGLCGVETGAPSMQGSDLSPLVHGKGAQDDPWAFSTGGGADPRVIAMQNSKYKLIMNPWDDDEAVELYDLTTDPGEQHDLSAVRTDLVQSLKEVMDRHIESLERFGSLPSVQIPLTDQDIERLKALGYL